MKLGKFGKHFLKLWTFEILKRYDWTIEHKRSKAVVDFDYLEMYELLQQNKCLGMFLEMAIERDPKSVDFVIGNRSIVSAVKK